MTSAAAIIPAMAALLLHAGLALITMNMLSPQDKVKEPPKPIEVALIPEVPSVPSVQAPPVPPPPSPPPVPLTEAPQVRAAPAPPVEKKRVPPKPRMAPKPEPALQPSQTQAEALETQPEESSAPPRANATATPSPAVPTPELPSAAAPAAPSRTSVSIPASYAATNRKPEYPRLSRQLEEQGTVVLRVLVKADGTAGAVEIRTSSGFPLLDQSARNAVLTWRFNPATNDNKPVDEWFLIPIPFKLQN